MLMDVLWQTQAWNTLNLVKESKKSCCISCKISEYIYQNITSVCQNLHPITWVWVVKIASILSLFEKDHNVAIETKPNMNLFRITNTFAYIFGFGFKHLTLQKNQLIVVNAVAIVPNDFVPPLKNHFSVKFMCDAKNKAHKTIVGTYCCWF